MPGETGFVIARDDRDAFIRQLVEVVQADNTTKSARAEHARNYARTTFDHDRQITRYLELFKQQRSQS